MHERSTGVKQTGTRMLGGRAEHQSLGVIVKEK